MRDAKQIKLVIADDEQLICGLLAKTIDFEGLCIELAGTAHDGETLLALAEEVKPDIIITDISMPKVSGLEVVRRLSESGSRCRVVIISGYKQFEYAYNALKYEVKNYLLKPIDDIELNWTLKKIVTEIREEREASEGSRYEATLRNMLLTRYIDSPEIKDETVDSINKKFCTRFSPGIFRMVSIKVNFAQEARRFDLHSPSPTTDAFRTQVEERFLPRCFDGIAANSYEGAMALLNYSPEREEEIKKSIREMFGALQEVSGRFFGTTITMCVSETLTDVTRLSELKSHVFTAEWHRMYAGIGRLIYYSEAIEAPAVGFSPRLAELEKQADAAMEIYDANRMAACVDDFFALPENVIASGAGYGFVQHIVQLFTEMDEELLTQENGETLNIGNLFRVIHFCASFTVLHYELKSTVSRILHVVSGNLSMMQSRPIRQIYAYIQEHYAEDVSLEVLAGAVGLSPVYFSALFKKETGTNIKEYITDYRIAKAKELLKNGGMNISEVAYATGFADVRYFSKLFKKVVGVKPTEYRKIYG